ncbi:hypothetical protein EVAR_23697_1, partial [Eumeta japonica]
MSRGTVERCAGELYLIRFPRREGGRRLQTRRVFGFLHVRLMEFKNLFSSVCSNAEQNMRTGYAGCRNATARAEQQSDRKFTFGERTHSCVHTEQRYTTTFPERGKKPERPRPPAPTGRPLRRAPNETTSVSIVIPITKRMGRKICPFAAVNWTDRGVHTR